MKNIEDLKEAVAFWEHLATKRKEQLDNFEVYRVFYPDEFEHPDEVDLIARGSLVKYVNGLIPCGRISQETLDLFYEKHQHGIQTSEDAVELLEADGYNVCLTKVWTGEPTAA